MFYISFFLYNYLQIRNDRHGYCHELVKLLDISNEIKLHGLLHSETSIYVYLNVINTCVTFLGILISCMSDVAFYYLRLDRYNINVGMFWLHVRCHT